MFGPQTVVVGNMPNTMRDAAIAAARELDDNKIDHTEIIRVYEWAWLGEWIQTLQEIIQKHRDTGKTYVAIKEGLARRKKLLFSHVNGNWSHFVAGADHFEHFHLDINRVFGDSDPTLGDCARVAANSLVRNDKDELKFVYSLIVTEDTFHKANSRIMFQALRERQSFIMDGLIFQIRVFVVKKDGSVEMHKLS